MHVVPDVVPQFHPSFDLRVSFPEYQTKVTSTAPKYRFVEPGIYVLPEQVRFSLLQILAFLNRSKTMDPPRLHKDVFHLDERLYTLIMVDPGNEYTDLISSIVSLGYRCTRRGKQHVSTLPPLVAVRGPSIDVRPTVVTSLFRPNIPMSATSPSLISNINSHTKYIPPHPQKGTQYHRYTVLLLPQTSPINVPILEMDERFGFSVRGFMAKHGLDPSTGGGAHMWRGEWNPTVSRIYQDLLSKHVLLTSKLCMIKPILTQRRMSLCMASHQNQTGMQMSGERTGIACSGVGKVFLHYDLHISVNHTHVRVCAKRCSTSIEINTPSVDDQ